MKGKWGSARVSVPPVIRYQRWSSSRKLLTRWLSYFIYKCKIKKGFEWLDRKVQRQFRWYGISVRFFLKLFICWQAYFICKSKLIKRGGGGSNLWNARESIPPVIRYQRSLFSSKTLPSLICMFYMHALSDKEVVNLWFARAKNKKCSHAISWNRESLE